MAVRHVTTVNKNKLQFLFGSGSTCRKSTAAFHIVVDEYIYPSGNSRSDKKNKISFNKGSLNKNASNTSFKKESTDACVNAVNIQMISSDLREQIFGSQSNTVEDNSLLKTVIEDLKKFGLWKEPELVPGVTLNLPKLMGKNIEEHFWHIGNEQTGPYKTLLLDFCDKNLPDVPTQWLCQAGWTRYCKGSDPEKVPFPDEDALVFDVEVCMNLGQAPTLATAVSSNAWYAWISPSLPGVTEPIAVQHYTPDMFIPLEGKGINRSRPRIVVGHNVAYDRARVKEQYRLENSGLRFMDTMSMHVCIGGVTSYQRAVLKAKAGPEESDWRDYAALNSLKEVYKFYCKEEISKETRDIFVEGTMSDVRGNFQEVMKYCAQDVIATYKVLKEMLPQFFDRFPHPVTLGGMLELGTAYLPVNSNWRRYLDDAEQTYEDLEKECKYLLTKKSDNACELLHNNEYEKDLWLWDEDWSTQELKLTKKKPKKEETISCETLDEEQTLESNFKHLFDNVQRLPIKLPLLPGYPLWYRKLCEKPTEEDWEPGPHLISTSVKIAPKILKLTWEKYPLHHTREHGWGVLVADLNASVVDSKVPYDKLKILTEDNGGGLAVGKAEIPDLSGIRDKVDVINAFEDVPGQKQTTKVRQRGTWSDLIVDNCCYFLKLPHKDGPEKNVGNPLARDFIKTFSSSVLAGADEVAEKVLAIGRKLSYWRNNRERIMGQLVAWSNTNQGAILPQVVVCGTLTRRAMERTWLTASNAQGERIGSELRSLVQAPDGYHMVGADVDSQELWIASVIGDAAYAGMHACTPFGWMTLSGSKSSGTDMHSVTAAAANISRDHAKVINYARIYGAGTRFAQQLLRQFNPEMSETEAKTKATKMFLMTKGRKVYKLKNDFKDQLPSDISNVHTGFSAARVAKLLGKPVNEVFERPKWEGGSESAMFNRLEDIACSKEPRTPFLSARLSRAVEPKWAGDDSFLTTRVNWVVQSGAADFLHLMLVSIRWLSEGKMRFCLSFHDEVRYLVPSHLRYEAALVLHITNLLTRAFCAQRLGLKDLPQSVAFFSSVEIDKVLRKEAHDDCKTPSNPHGLEKGYNIPPGESLDIATTLKKCGGKLTGIFSEKKTR